MDDGDASIEAAGAAETLFLLFDISDSIVNGLMPDVLTSHFS